MRNLRFPILTFIFLTLLVSSCDDGSENDLPGSGCAVEFDRKAMLVNIGNNLIIPAYADLEQHTASLQAATADFVAAPDLTKLSTLRQKWLETSLAWQRAGHFAFGPAGGELNESEYLAEFMNTYPTNTSKIESALANAQYAFTTANVDRQGLAAMDYLINGLGGDDQAILNHYSKDSDKQAHRDYLKAVADKMQEKAKAVHEKWIGGPLNYIATFTANTGNDAGSPLTLMVNGTITYYERNIRDGKIGIPAGIRSLGTPLPEKVEARYKGDVSLMLAEESLEAYRDFYLGRAKNGNDGLGLQDYLAATGVKQFTMETPLHQAITDQMGQSIIHVQALPSPLQSAVTQSSAQVRETFDIMQSVTRLMKTEMAPALCVPITTVDNDGD